MFLARIKRFLNKKILNIKLKYLLSILVLLIPVEKIEVENSYKKTVTYKNIFGWELFRIESSSSLIVWFLFGKVINFKELDNFSEQDFFNDLKNELYYGN